MDSDKETDIPEYNRIDEKEDDLLVQNAKKAAQEKQRQQEKNDEQLYFLFIKLRVGFQPYSYTFKLR